MKYPIVLSIAGSDCSGGAGIQADLKTISALGCYAATAITAITVQNTCGVQDVFPVPSEIVRKQIQSVYEDLKVDVVKIGMVTDTGIISTIADFLESFRPVAVFDPVLVSSSGYPLVTSGALDLLRKRLMPLCTLITPNIPEAALLSGLSIRTPNDLGKAGKQMLVAGAQAVLIKGGHLEGDDMADLLLTGTTPNESHSYHTVRIVSNNTHGTGCTLSSAIAAYMAQGYPLPEAVGLAKQYLTEALIAGKDVTVGKGHGPLNHFFNPKKLLIR